MELNLEPFLRLCFLRIHATIDWRRPVEFLDKELQKIVRDAQTGPLRVDLLVQVFLLNGLEEWLLIHIENERARFTDSQRSS
ncbi:MAG: cytosolic protein, partial [Verrucomicrobiae bacterium]|nr:cytosolic protein [Verrucomicrobiae bacterium]